MLVGAPEEDVIHIAISLLLPHAPQIHLYFFDHFIAPFEGTALQHLQLILLPLDFIVHLLLENAFIEEITEAHEVDWAVASTNDLLTEYFAHILLWYGDFKVFGKFAEVGRRHDFVLIANLVKCEAKLFCLHVL